jgi:hypothetical protein
MPFANRDSNEFAYNLFSFSNNNFVSPSVSGLSNGNQTTAQKYHRVSPILQIKMGSFNLIFPNGTSATQGKRKTCTLTFPEVVSASFSFEIDANVPIRAVTSLLYLQISMIFRSKKMLNQVRTPEFSNCMYDDPIYARAINLILIFFLLICFRTNARHGVWGALRLSHNTSIVQLPLVKLAASVNDLLFNSVLRFSLFSSHSLHPLSISISKKYGYC